MALDVKQNGDAVSGTAVVVFDSEFIPDTMAVTGTAANPDTIRLQFPRFGSLGPQRFEGWRRKSGETYLDIMDGYVVIREPGWTVDFAFTFHRADGQANVCGW